MTEDVKPKKSFFPAIIALVGIVYFFTGNYFTDLIPVVGQIDDAIIGTIILGVFRYYGIDLDEGVAKFFERRSSRA